MNLEHESQEVPKNYVELYGIKIYGKEIGQASIEEMEKIQSNPTSEVHLARHYRNLPKDYQNSLIEQEFEYFDPKEQVQKKSQITLEKIQSALDVKGSKFSDGIELLKKYNIETPAKLIEKIKNYAIEQVQSGKITWFDGGFCKRAYLQIELPEPVGIDNVISISEVDQTNLEQQSRGKLDGDDFKVNVAKNNCGKLSNKISIIIGWINNELSPAIFMAHPGNHAPDFPKDQQTQEEKEYNKTFWENHAFVI